MKKIIAVTLFLCGMFLASEAKIVKGSVVSGTKKLPGVVVTDGRNFTQTRKNGTFRFDICDSAEFVYIITPSGYTADWSDGSPAFYQKVSDKSKYVFDLKDTGSTSDSYNIIAVGDPQPRSESHFAEFAGKPLDDIRQCAGSLTSPTVGIVLGDITFDKYHLMKSWKEKIVEAGIPFYPVIGNHDHNRKFNDDNLADDTYAESFGPADYAFRLGNDIVMVLDNIIYHSRSGYELGYLQRQLDWLKKLMKYVDKDADIYVAQHASLNGRHYAGMIKNHDVLLDIFRGHKVTFMSGHNHTNGNFDYAPGVMEHNVAAICGTWWDVYHCTDGTPRGYKVFSKNNGTLLWYYKSIGRDRNFQYEVYRPGQTRLHPDCIVVNVWDYDPQWKVEWAEDGKPMGAMTRVEEYSPLHEADMKAKYEKLGRKPSDYRLTKKSPHYFAAEPSPGVHIVTVTVQDRFGNRWSETIQL